MRLKNLQNKNKLGIFGGMGPEATADLYLKIIKKFQNNLDAQYNSDFPHIKIKSVPIPDGNMWTDFNDKEIKKVIKNSCDSLIDTGVDFIAVPCNAIDSYLHSMRNSFNVPILSITELTTKKINMDKLKKIGLLATKHTIKTKVYDESLEIYDIELLLPTEKQQKEIDRIIVEIESGDKSYLNKLTLIEIMQDLFTKGSQGIILGCTEIPLILSQEDSKIPLFNTTQILADECYRILTSPKITLNC